jgi:hypothetical protein
MKKAPKSPGLGGIPLALGSCCTGPTKSMFRDLKKAAIMCNHVRNLMVRHWERWHEDHPNYEPVDADKMSPSVYVDRKYFPKELVSTTYDSSMYRVAQKAYPLLAAKLFSACQKEVVHRLKSSMPPIHRQRWGHNSFRAKAILEFEANRDTRREWVIPVSKQDSTLCYAGQSAKKLTSGVDAEVHKYGDSSAVVRIPLWSNKSNRKQKAIICRVEVRQYKGRRVSPGVRRVLKKVASGEWKMRDSKVTYDEDHKLWKFDLIYFQPAHDLGLNPERTAVLVANDGKASHPFEITAPNGARWRLGQAGTYRQQNMRKENKRRRLRRQYRLAGPGARAHGQKRWVRDVKATTRRVRNIAKLFQQKVAAEIIQFCLKYNCGRLLYIEPPPNRRDNLWFKALGLSFDWTTFRSHLQHLCFKYVIQLADEVRAPAEAGLGSRPRPQGLKPKRKVPPRGNGKPKAKVPPKAKAPPTPADNGKPTAKVPPAAKTPTPKSTKGSKTRT